MRKVLRFLPLALLVAFLLMLPSIHRMAVQTDSFNYMSIAENVARGHGWINQTGKVELDHPFGYSLAMAPWVRLGLSARGAAFIVNWLSVAVVGLMAWVLLQELSGKTGWQVAVGAVLVMAAPPLMQFANQILTESMDAALALTFLWLCGKASA